jgi:hypothetical protein
MVPPFIEKKLASVLETEQDLLNTVLLATTRQRHDETGSQILAKEEAYRAAFQPHLQVQTERRNPSPIFIAALLAVRRLQIVDLPDEAFSADEDTRDRVVKATITQHYQKQHGQVPAFGRITGYVYVCIAEATLGLKRGDTG